MSSATITVFNRNITIIIIIIVLIIINNILKWKMENKYDDKNTTIRLTHCSRETPKRVFGKQCRSRSDAAERSV